MNYLKYFFLFVGITLLAACKKDIQKESIEGTIEEVVDGNTVVLSTGTPIHLEGIDPDNTFTKEYLVNNYIGREVYVNIGADDYPYISSWDEDFDGFLLVSKDGEEDECINRTLLTVRHDAYYADNIGDEDSTKVYEELVRHPGPRHLLTDNQLAAKMKAASMFVYITLGDSRVVFGTAFLINKQGLALTNCHVLQEAPSKSDIVIYLSDSEGNISESKKYGVKDNIVMNSTYDYAIFYVDFDEDARRNLTPLPLTKLSFAAGDKVAVVGNPVPGGAILPMRWAAGKISSYNETDRANGCVGIDVAITHGFSGGPLCNYYGEVVGISRSGFENNDANLNFAVDIFKVREKLNELNYVYEGK